MSAFATAKAFWANAIEECENKRIQSTRQVLQKKLWRRDTSWTTQTDAFDLEKMIWSEIRIQSFVGYGDGSQIGLGLHTAKTEKRNDKLN